MDHRSLSKSALPRRAPNLPPIRTDVSRPLPDRPRLQKSRSQGLRLPAASNTQSENGLRQSEPVKRQTSKTNLKSIFSRNKSVHQSKNHDSNLPVLGERRGSTPDYAYVPDTPRSLKSMTSIPTIAASSGLATPTVANAKSKIPSKAVKQRSVYPTTSPWTPPPLFQAYPQAVKHACLSAPNLSADSIVRIHALKSNDSQYRPSHHQDPAVADAAQKKKERREKTHARKISGSISKTLWANKIYVLVTSGYLLQYAAEGPFDQLPEKMMRLGPSSAAFASDAIPGKPWVLQVSQKSSDDSKVPTESPRGILSRFGIQSADSRRLARTFFLVLTNPEEMTSWLVALRTTIESVGGKKFVPEAAAEDSGIDSPIYNRSLASTNNVQSAINVRKSSLTDISQTSGSIRSSRRSPASSVHRQNSYQKMPGSANAVNRRSVVGYTPPETTSLSTDGSILREIDPVYENPRDPPHPPKNTSISSERSPPLPSSSLSPQSPSGSLRFHRERHPASMNNRQSMYAYPSTQSDRKSRESEVDVSPLSVIGNTTPVQSNSPPPPNFSVPSFSRRYVVPRRGSRPSLASQDSNPSLSTVSSLESMSTIGTETPRTRLSPKRDPGAGSNINPTKRRSLVYDASYIRDPRPRQPSHSNPASSIPTSRPPNASSPDPQIDSPKSFVSSVYSSHRVQSPEVPLLPPANMANIAFRQRSGIPTSQSRSSVMLPKPTSGSPSTSPSASGNHDSSSSPRKTQTICSPRETETPSALPATSSKLKRPSPVHEVKPAKTTSFSAVNARTGQQQSSIPSSSSASQQVSPRKSMPHLSRGPPVAPPPNCPLPEVPLNIASQHCSVWSSRSLSPGTSSPDLRRRSADVRQLVLAAKQRTAALAAAVPPS